MAPKDVAARVSGSYSAELSAVVEIRGALRGWGSSIELRLSDVQRIELAVTEVCNNIIIHGYSSGRFRDPVIEVEAEADDDRVTVTLVDCAPRFPLPYPLPELPSNFAGGGYGLPIVGQVTAEFRCEPNEPDGNMWVLEFPIER